MVVPRDGQVLQRNKKRQLALPCESRHSSQFKALRQFLRHKYMDPIELKLFASRSSAVCDEMGLVLRRAAFSPNIKDRLDFSCALFDANGRLFAQAAHIPVHLGSMAYAMGALVGRRQWQPGDVLVVNDPFLGGTHLPDVTLVSPVFLAGEAGAVAFVANRAHHADIGCDTPGSMPVSTSLEQEGRIIPPTLLLRDGKLQADALALLGINGQLGGDFAAQHGANVVGVARLQRLMSTMTLPHFHNAVAALNEYAARISRNAIAEISPGNFEFSDLLDDDGIQTDSIPLQVRLEIGNGGIKMDFSGSADQVPGNMNCPESVVAAAAYYCIRCLLPDHAPVCAGLFDPVTIVTRTGSIVNAQRPAAVAAGNVETSMRLVDLVFGALAQALPGRIAAASQGTMNNVAMGNSGTAGEKRWDYYETIAGGTGGGPRYAGLNGVQSHMTNTLNTPVESLEMHYPLRVLQYALRDGSGGGGGHPGGNGVVREYEFLGQAQCSLLSERRRHAPWGLQGGACGLPGQNWLNGEPIAGKCSLQVKAGDRLLVHTPGGGGFGRAGADDVGSQTL
ncbi:MAG: hydantoinase B/oxoprolinase family protein [Gammaproteobacteria bacterium]